MVNSDSGWVALSAEFCAHFRVKTERNYQHATAKDLAVYLSLVGLITGLPYDVYDPTKGLSLATAKAIKQFSEMAEVGVLVPWARLGAVLGTRSRTLIQRSIVRVMHNDLNGRRFISGLGGRKAKDMTIVGDWSQLAKAWPVFSRHNTKIIVDAHRFARFSSRFSLPIFLRSLSWLETGCRVGLTGCQLVKIGGLIEVTVPRAAVFKTLALNIDKSTLGEASKALTAVERDCAAAGLDVGFAWRKAGKEITHLVMTARQVTQTGFVDERAFQIWRPHHNSRSDAGKRYGPRRVAGTCGEAESSTMPP